MTIKGLIFQHYVLIAFNSVILNNVGFDGLVDVLIMCECEIIKLYVENRTKD